MADPNELLNQTRETARVVEDALRSIAAKVGDIFEDAITNVDTFSKSLTKDITGSLNSLAKVSKQLEENQTKLTAGSLKRSDIEKQILARTAKIKAIEDQLNIARDAGLITEIEKTQILAEHESYTNELIKHLNKQAEVADEINKKLGLTGGILKGFTKIPILGSLIDSEKVLNRVQKEAGKSTSSRFSVFKEGAKGIGSSLMENLTSPFSLALAGITAIVKIFKFFIDAMFEADKRVTNIAKNFSISKDSARAQYEALQQTKGVLTTNLALTSNIVDAFNELSAISEFTYQASIGQLDTQIQLTKEIGIQAEEATQLQQLFMLNNNEADKGLDIVYDQIAAFANQNKIVADGRKVIADINKLSGLIKLNFRGNTGELVKTVLEAKKLGLTLDQITNTQSSLLDFESSISSQIEAELLTGRQINLERARLFALNNDIAGLTEEIAKQNITAASFSRMNAIQQESIAKTLGMNASTLGDTLYKQELINKAGGQELKNKRDYIALLKKQGKDSEAARLQQELTALEAGLIRGESLEDAQKSLDAQTKFTAALDQAKEIFTDLVDGGTLDSLADIIKEIADTLSDLAGNRETRLSRERERIEGKLGKSYNEEEIKNLQEIASPSLVRKIFNTIADSFLPEASLMRKIEQQSAEIALKSIKTIDSSNKTATTEPKIVNAKDFVIKTLPEDTVVAAGGTRLGNTNELLKTQQETNMILKQLLTKNTNIYMDSNKVSTTISQNSFNVGQ